MNYDIFIPVRLKNSIFPDKALKICNGKPIIQYLIERLQTCKKIRKTIVCTTNQKSDDLLVEFLKKHGINFFRGDDKDILERFLDAARKYDTEFIVNVDGDDIYTDPKYVDYMIVEYEKTNVDVIDMVGFPFGLRSIGFKKKILKKICSLKKTNTTDTHYRAFITELNLFKVHKILFESRIDYSKKIRLTLDYPQDLELAKKIFNKLGNNFHIQDLLKLFKDEPSLLDITANLDLKWKEHYNNTNTDFSIKSVNFGGVSV